MTPQSLDEQQRRAEGYRELMASTKCEDSYPRCHCRDTQRGEAMKLSAKKRSAVYAVIHRKLTDARIKIATSPRAKAAVVLGGAGDSVDVWIAQLETPLFRDIMAALGVDETKS